MSARPVRPFAVALAATLAALLAALLPAAGAHAVSRAVQGGRLDWGLKSSFQSYVTGPVAKGGFQLRGGAATVGGSLFRFHSATGTYDPDTGAFEAAFSGGVAFHGHPKPDGTHELDLTISRPAIRIEGGSGTLYADVVGRAEGTGRTTSLSRVPFATLGLGGIDMRGSGSPLALTNVPATLTEQGAQAFAGYYPAGTPLDPITLSVDVRSAPAAAPSPSPSAAAGASPGAQTPAGRGAFADAAVDWGVRRTFREYVTGAVGQGRWTLAEGAQDGGALFRFPQGKGAYDGRKGTLDAAFAGTVHFTGAHLDLKLGKVVVRVEGGKGVLSTDVTTGGDTKPAVPLVEFDAAGLKTEGALATLAEARATLTEDGSRALGSMYKAGTEMDPVSLAVALDATAHLPALPDLGSAQATPAGPQTTASPAAGPSATAPRSGGGSDAGLYAALAAALLVPAGGAGWLLALRRRRARAASAAESASASVAESASGAQPGHP
ncbi:HtaA domain-containing protein [Streptomyces sp. NPDC004050]